MSTTPAGFEPARAEHSSLAGCRLNHSAKVSRDDKMLLKVLRDGESNPGHLRDRQRCYQLHHRGSLILDVTLLTGFEPATSRLEV